LQKLSSIHWHYSNDKLVLMNWSAIGAALLGIAVMLGAFGAHALRDRLDAYSLGIWEKAVFYHFIHAIGLLVTPLLAPRAANTVGVLLVAGILLFSGSLYALALTGNRMLGAVTPLGGLAFIAAWLWLAFDLFRSKS
jgi:uncharacterized membrane protein YgdD (TMEM256/DUF423 family)